jgi:hypothetical protein
MDTNMPEDDCSLPLVLYTAGDGRELALVLYTAKRESIQQLLYCICMLPLLISFTPLQWGFFFHFLR